MVVIGQSHLLWRSRVPDHISHSNTIVRIDPIEVILCHIKYIMTFHSIKYIFIYKHMLQPICEISLFMNWLKILAFS